MVVRLNKRIHIVIQPSTTIQSAVVVSPGSHICSFFPVVAPAQVDLRASYENNDIVRFERLLRDKRNRILDDAFIMT